MPIMTERLVKDKLQNRKFQIFFEENENYILILLIYKVKKITKF